MVRKGEAHRPFDTAILSGEVFKGSEPVSAARDTAREFLTRVQAVHGIPVSPRAMDMVQLVVSELVTNAYKYAPGPYLLDLVVDGGGGVEICVWDAEPRLPTVHPPDVGGWASTAWRSSRARAGAWRCGGRRSASGSPPWSRSPTMRPGIRPAARCDPAWSLSAARGLWGAKLSSTAPPTCPRGSGSRFTRDGRFWVVRAASPGGRPGTRTASTWPGPRRVVVASPPVPVKGERDGPSANRRLHRSGAGDVREMDGTEDARGRGGLRRSGPRQEHGCAARRGVAPRFRRS